MLFNKNIFAKVNDKKVLHKIGKRWITISVGILAMLGFGAMASGTTTHAANTEVAPQVETMGKAPAKAATTPGKKAPAAPTTPAKPAKPTTPAKPAQPADPDATLEAELTQNQANAAKDSSANLTPQDRANMAGTVKSNASALNNNPNATAQQKKDAHHNANMARRAANQAERAAGTTPGDLAHQKHTNAQNQKAKDEAEHGPALSPNQKKQAGQADQVNNQNDKDAEQWMAHHMNQNQFNNIINNVPGWNAGKKANAQKTTKNERHAFNKANHSAAVNRKKANDAARAAGTTPGDLAHKASANASAKAATDQINRNNEKAKLAKKSAQDQSARNAAEKQSAYNSAEKAAMNDGYNDTNNAGFNQNKSLVNYNKAKSASASNHVNSLASSANSSDDSASVSASTSISNSVSASNSIADSKLAKNSAEESAGTSADDNVNNNIQNSLKSGKSVNSDTINSLDNSASNKESSALASAAKSANGNKGNKSNNTPNTPNQPNKPNTPNKPANNGSKGGNVAPSRPTIPNKPTNNNGKGSNIIPTPNKPVAPKKPSDHKGNNVTPNKPANHKKNSSNVTPNKPNKPTNHNSKGNNKPNKPASNSNRPVKPNQPINPIIPHRPNNDGGNNSSSASNHNQPAKPASSSNNKPVKPASNSNSNHSNSSSANNKPVKPASNTNKSASSSVNNKPAKPASNNNNIPVTPSKPTTPVTPNVPFIPNVPVTPTPASNATNANVAPASANSSSNDVAVPSTPTGDNNGLIICTNSKTNNRRQNGKSKGLEVVRNVNSIKRGKTALYRGLVIQHLNNRISKRTKYVVSRRGSWLYKDIRGGKRFFAGHIVKNRRIRVIAMFNVKFNKHGKFYLRLEVRIGRGRHAKNYFVTGNKHAVKLIYGNYHHSKRFFN